MFRFPSKSQRRSLVLTEFLLAGACYLAASCLSIEAATGFVLWYEGTLVSIVFVAAVIVATLHIQGLYSQSRIRSRIGLGLQLITTMGVAFLSQALLAYAYRGAALPLPVMLYGSVLASFVLFGARLVYFHMVARGFGREPVLLVGFTPLMEEIAAGLGSHPEVGMVAAGFVTDQLPAGTEVAGVRVLGGLDELVDICRETHPDHVVVDLSGNAVQILPALARKLLGAGISLERPHRLYEMLFQRVAEVTVDPAAMIFENPVPPPAAAIAIQSVYNNVIGLALLALSAPLMAFIAVSIRATSSGPVREMRSMAGWDMIPFTLFRFRCTGVPGRWLLRLHLDKLPQLVNLLRGEIALVGPRPVPAASAAETLEQLPGYRHRFVVKPGFFGLAQNHVPPPVSPDEVIRELQYDLYYVKHLSIALDCSIVWQRMTKLFRRVPRAESAQA
jgi:lipopolysaccharide/colanic/teichoic acid biosynthesis glycosyltransferase